MTKQKRTKFKTMQTRIKERAKRMLEIIEQHEGVFESFQASQNIFLSFSEKHFAKIFKRVYPNLLCVPPPKKKKDTRKTNDKKGTTVNY